MQEQQPKTWVGKDEEKLKNRIGRAIRGGGGYVRIVLFGQPGIFKKAEIVCLSSAIPVCVSLVARSCDEKGQHAAPKKVHECGQTLKKQRKPTVKASGTLRIFFPTVLFASLRL